jgi:hypothetical protein
MEHPQNPVAGSQETVQPGSLDTTAPEAPVNGSSPALSPTVQPESATDSRPVDATAKDQVAVPHPAVLADEEYQKAMAPLKPQPAIYLASLLLTGSIVPIPSAAATITATLYITSPDWASFIPFISPKLLVIFVGLLGTLLLWLLASLPFKRFTSFDSADVRSAGHLRRHILALKSSLKILREPVSSSAAEGEHGNALRTFRAANPQDYDLALDTLRSCLVEANRQVANEKLNWILGSGYIGVWNFVQRAEEALLMVAPREYVIREALHDEASIDGSTIANRDYILSNTKTAVKVLSPSSSIYLKSLSAQDQSLAITNSGVSDHTAMPTVTSPLQVQNKILYLTPELELEARNALRDARQTLNEFRSSLWEGLITLRNQLFGTALITAFLTYVLLFVAIGAGINPESMKAALVFYLVGATVGIFSRLYTESQTSSAVDDYGLTVGRVAVTPLVSGLAAIAGVLVVAVLSINILNTPGDPSNHGLPSLDVVYNLGKNSQGIVVAALFGLTPNRLINVLQQRADDTKTRLQNSSAPSQGNN